MMTPYGRWYMIGGWVVTAILAVLIAALTLMPIPSGVVSGSDKFHHILAFACLAFPLPFVRPRLALWVVVGVISYGGVIELIQPAFGRTAEWLDLLADGVGAVIGATVARGLGLWLSRNNP